MTDKAKGGRVMKQQHYARYLYAGLWLNGHLKQHRVHRLVLTAFVGPCPDGMECLHGEGGALDNRLTNLRWGTKSENMLEHAATVRKTHCPHGHPYDEANTYVRPDGRGRGCLACSARRSREQNQRRRLARMEGS